MKRLLICLALSACTSFAKVDDAGPRDAGTDVGQRDSATDSATGDSGLMDSGSADTRFDAGPVGECVGLDYTGVLDPAFDPSVMEYELTIPFAELRSRLTRVDMDGRPCGGVLRSSNAVMEIDDEGWFIPVAGATFSFEEVAIAIEIAEPTLEQTIAGPGESSSFGAALSAEENEIVVGAPTDSRGASNAGAVFMWDATRMGGPTVLHLGENTGERLGTQVHLRDGHLVAMAPGEGGVMTGFIRVFSRSDGTWSDAGRIEPIVPPTPFSSHVRTQGGQVFVGPEMDQVGIYESAGADWTRNTSISPPGSNTNFGRRFEISGDVMLIQDSGGIEIRIYAFDGSVWDDRSAFGDQDPGALFAIDGSHVVIVGPTETTTYIPNETYDARATFPFGLDAVRSVAIRHGRIAFGLDDAEGLRVITAYLVPDDRYPAEPVTWAEGATIPAPEGADGFGASLAFTESAGLVVGAPGHMGRGAIFLYE